MKRPLLLNLFVLLLYSMRFMAHGGEAANKWLRAWREHYRRIGIEIG